MIRPGWQNRQAGKWRSAGASHADFGWFSLTPGLSALHARATAEPEFSSGVPVPDVRCSGHVDSQAPRVPCPVSRDAGGVFPVGRRDPAGQAAGAPAPGRADGRAPPSRLPAAGGPRPALRGGTRGPVAGPGGVAERRLQVRSARQVVRLEAGAAVPAAGDGGEQHPVPDPVRARGVPEPRLLLPCGDDPPARRRLAGGARAPGAPGGDVLRPGQVFRHHVQGGGLGVPGPDEGVRPRQRALHRPPRQAEGDLRDAAGPDARALLSSPQPLPPDVAPPAGPGLAPRDPGTMRSLHAELAAVPDFRRRRAGSTRWPACSPCTCSPSSRT